MVIDEEILKVLDPKVLETLSDEEKEVLINMLGEMVNEGKSDTLNNLWESDYDEIPVDIDTFLEDDDYLGTSTDNGRSIYPFWREAMREWFAPDAPYMECLSGDTKLPLLNGKTMAIKEVHEYLKDNKEIYLYSFDNNKHEVTAGKCVKSKHSGKRSTYLITLDNGEQVRLTGNHRLLLRNNTWKYTKDLVVGDSLMPYVVEKVPNGYEIIHHPTKDRSYWKECTYKMVQRYKYGSRKGWQVHHKNFRKHDNSPSNLVLCTNTNHFNYHNKNQLVRLAEPINREFFCSQISKGVRRFFSNMSESELKLYQAKRGAKISKHWRDNYEYHSESVKNNSKGFMNSPEGKLLATKNLAAYNTDLTSGDPTAREINRLNRLKALETRWNNEKQRKQASIRMTKMNNTNNFAKNIADEFWNSEKGSERKDYLSDKFKDFNSNNHPKLRKDITRENVVDALSKSHTLIEATKLLNCSRQTIYNRLGADNYKDYLAKNHKIIAIEFLEEEIDVYDLEIEGTHNFALSCGIFAHNCILSGSIGIGKTTIADIGLAYLLYKLLCLKNPQEYYGLTKSSIMTVAFINVDMALAYGVSYAKFQSLLLNSPWFLRHGTVAGIKNQVYLPSKGIEFRVGSSDKNVLGSDVFCLSGDTEINTVEHGLTKLSNLTGEIVTFYQVDDKGEITVSNPSSVIPTKRVKELVELELEDGTKIKVTPDHKLLMDDGSYKLAKDINEGDELYET